MSLVSVNWHPSRRDLNVFRLTAVGVAILIAVLLYTVKHVELRWSLTVVAVGAGIGVSGFVSLTLTRFIYVGMMAVTWPIGFLVSLVLMGVFYFGLITPLGLIFRLIGRDAMQRRFDPEARTYWIPHRQVTKAERYFQQF